MESRAEHLDSAGGRGEAKRLTSEKDRDIQEYAWERKRLRSYAQTRKATRTFHSNGLK